MHHHLHVRAGSGDAELAAPRAMGRLVARKAQADEHPRRGDARVARLQLAVLPEPSTS